LTLVLSADAWAARHLRRFGVTSGVSSFWKSARYPALQCVSSGRNPLIQLLAATRCISVRLRKTHPTSGVSANEWASVGIRQRLIRTLPSDQKSVGMGSCSYCGVQTGQGRRSRPSPLHV